MNIEMIRELLASWKIDQLSILSFTLIMVLGNGLAEELFWRGFLYKKFSNIKTEDFAVIITSLLFGLHHLVTTSLLFAFLAGVPLTLTIIGGGFIWGTLRKNHNSIYAPLLSHIMADFAIIIVLFKMII